MSKKLHDFEIFFNKKIAFDSVWEGHWLIISVWEGHWFIISVWEGHWLITFFKSNLKSNLFASNISISISDIILRTIVVRSSFSSSRY